jgi:hypothetical protein
MSFWQWFDQLPWWLQVIGGALIGAWAILPVVVMYAESNLTKIAKNTAAMRKSLEEIERKLASR